MTLADVATGRTPYYIVVAYISHTLASADSCRGMAIGHHLLVRTLYSSGIHQPYLVVEADLSHVLVVHVAGVLVYLVEVLDFCI